MVMRMPRPRARPGAFSRSSATAPMSVSALSRISVPKTGGSFMGKTHQAWLGLKSAITGRDDKAIIDEVERGEDYLKDRFETALGSGDLSGESRSVVERCFQSVRAGHDQISQIKHGMEAG